MTAAPLSRSDLIHSRPTVCLCYFNVCDQLVFTPKSLMMFCKVALKITCPTLSCHKPGTWVSSDVWTIFGHKDPGPSPILTLLRAHEQRQCLWCCGSCSSAPLLVYEWDCHEITRNNAGIQCHSCEPGKAAQPPAKHELLSSLVILLSALKSQICVN